MPNSVATPHFSFKLFHNSFWPSKYNDFLSNVRNLYWKRDLFLARDLSASCPRDVPTKARARRITFSARDKPRGINLNCFYNSRGGEMTVSR